MLAISQHVSVCDDCASEAQAIRDLGDSLRGAAMQVSKASTLDGLASGVVSRVRAEQAHSWTALFHRAVEDWHWALVGFGSVSAACVSVLFVSMLLLLGPAPQRDDSLAGQLNNLGSSAGTIFLLTSGGDRNSSVVEFDDGGAGPAMAARVMPAQFAMPTESDLVAQLNSLLVMRDGRIIDVRTMSQADRQRTEALLDQINRLRTTEPRGPADTIRVHQIGLVASLSVSAKAL
jgi:hypothetical protein